MFPKNVRFQRSFECKKKKKKKEQHETLILKWISNIEFHSGGGKNWFEERSWTKANIFNSF